jgi:ribonuclease P protein component
VRSEFLTLKYAPSKKDDYRLAIVVSKKVSKSAVKRNRIRRRIYEIVRIAHKTAGQPWPYDFVLSVFDERIGTLPAPELEAGVMKLFHKALQSKR